MKFFIKRQDLYPSLQKIINIVSHRSKLPILRHILMEVNGSSLLITGTNLEIEITAKILLSESYSYSSITISGYKFFEICRNFPEDSLISVELNNSNKLSIRSGCSNFCLSTLPAIDFPRTEKKKETSNIVVSQYILKKMIELVKFSMGNQDVRFYLNGIFFESNNHTIRMVSTDGYRLAMCEVVLEDVLLPSKSAIIPRIGVLEILHLLNINKEIVNLQIFNNCICAYINNYVFSSKLIVSSFPNYRKVFPNKTKAIFEIDRIILKQALKRVSVLSNEKLRIVNLNLKIDQLKITAHNFEQEMSEEILNISYSYEDIDISFNVDYLMDIVNVIDTRIIKFFLIDSVSSVQIMGIPKYYGSIYILMPIRI